MTAAAVTLPAPSSRRAGAPARRAILRWAFRMFRRDWRRQALILGLLTAAVAATTLGLAVITNVAELHADPTFGSANTIMSLSGSDRQLPADIAALQQRFGSVDVVAHLRVPVPGSVSTIDIRAENPHGPFAAPTVRLDAGRYPTRADEIAVTNAVASTFDLHRGGSWAVAGKHYTVVGTVENPLDLSDNFALVAPGALASPTDISVLADVPGGNVGNFQLPSHTGLATDSRGTTPKSAIEGAILALATIGMLFVGLLAVAGFAVVAQRRMRALGVLSSVGARDRSVRLVMLANGAAVGITAAVAGGALGFVVWLTVYRALQSTVDHRINPFDLPWFAVVLGLVLAFVTSVLAAWWPAPAARVPIVAALSGRPPERQPAHRFAAAGVLVLAAGIVLLAFADKHRSGFIIGGTIASVVGLLLFAPLAIQGVARLAGHTTISLRLALRDLARYQARSGAALGAATLAIAIAATIAISAASVQTTTANANLPANELVVYVGQKSIGPGSAVPVMNTGQTAAVDSVVNQLAASLHTNAVELEAPYNPSAPVQQPGQGPGDQLGGRSTVSLAHVIPLGAQGLEINQFADLYVATPQLLAQFGVKPSQIGATTEIITSRTDLGQMSIFDPTLGPGTGPKPNIHPSFPKPSVQLIRQLPTYGSDPTALITPNGLHALGLAAMPTGWLLHAPSVLTSAQIEAARRAAASAGLVIETRSAPKSFAPLRNWSTAAGILVALGVLAMTVGLIRSEAGRDMSTLTATGASSRTRRTITGATTGALALLGAVLGTAGAYAASLAWHRSDLHPLTRVPWTNLSFIVIVLPLVATAAGWLLAGREPPTMSRQPLE